MNTTNQSSIFMLRQEHFRKGKCACCDKPTVLKFADATSGHTFGQCCLADVIIADRYLSTAPNSGVRHPTPAECTELID
jgi:hypothetical protein